jgi:4,5-DOPA dioxygenase extradiol
MSTLPSLFISHGSPMTAIEPGAAGAFMQRLGPAIDAAFGRPTSIVVLSAHTMTREPAVLAGPRHEAVYDFGGFDPKLRTLRYDTAGDPALASRVQQLVADAGLPIHRIDESGLDHGIWTPLCYMYPDAGIPVLPLAWVPHWSPAQQMALGDALRPLASDGVLVIGSGSITHNLRLFMNSRPAIDAPEAAQSRAFRDWFAATSAARDWDAMLAYRTRAPHAAEMHPTDEHLLPWYAAAGAGGRDHAPVRLHDSAAYAFIGMDAYAFGPGAGALQAALAAH